MKVLVTGAAGRLGSAVCHHLVQEGFEVRATDQRAGRQLPVRVDVADLLDREACYRLVEGMEAIIHLGNHPNEHSGNAQRVLGENMTININVLQAATELGVLNVSFASSIQVISGARHYTEGETLTPSELAFLPMTGDLPRNPGNAYALSKACTEQMLEYFAKCHGLSATALRFPGLLPREWMKGAHRRWGGGAGMFHVHLDEGFSYLTTEDASALLAAILRHPMKGYRCYQPSAYTPRIRTPVPEIIEKFFWNVPLRKPVSEMRGLVDVSKIEQDTGWQPKDEMFTE